MSTKRERLNRDHGAAIKVAYAHEGSPAIAARFGVSSETILRILRDRGVEIRLHGPRPGSRHPTKRIAALEWHFGPAIEAAYRRQTSVFIAAILGTTPSTVLRILRRRGVRIRPQNYAPDKMPAPLAEIVRMRAEGQTCQQIGQTFGVSRQTISERLRRGGKP